MGIHQLNPPQNNPSSRVVSSRLKVGHTLFPRKLGLIVRNTLDLGRTGTRGIKAVRHPVRGKFLRNLDADNTLPETQHLGIIRLDRPLDRERVVRGHSADPGHFVRGDGDAQARAADQQRAVCFAVLDELSCLHGDVGVGRLVGGVWHTDVGHAGDVWAGFEEGFERVFVADAGVVAGHGDAERGGHCDGFVLGVLFGG